MTAARDTIADSACWWPAYVGLGTNLGDRAATIAAAYQDLAALPETRLVARSNTYESAPMGPPGQADYLNAAAGLLTRRTPPSLLADLQAIEARHGRRRDGPRWGPRTLDLDLLVYADRVVDGGDLVLPHPGVAERAFVLAPLADIAPALRVPGAGRVAELLERIDPGGVRRYAG